MSLRARTLLLVLLALALCTIALFTTVRWVAGLQMVAVERQLQEGFDQLEQEEALRNAQRALDAVGESATQLSVKASDWARWDDMWEFVARPSPAFDQANLQLSSLSDLHLHFLLILDTLGSHVRWLGVEPETGDAAPVPDGIDAWLKPGQGLLRNGENLGQRAPLSGLISLPHRQVALLTSQAILQSDGTGPTRGTLVFGQLLDEKLLADIGGRLHLNLHLLPLDSLHSSTGTFLVHSPANLICYAPLRDLWGNPVATLRINLPRPIQYQAARTNAEIRQANKRTMDLLLLSVLLTGCVLLVVIIAVLERTILRRLRSFSATATTISLSGDFSRRMPDHRNPDEVGKLAAAINLMLNALEHSHLELEQRDASLRLLLDTVPAGLLTLDSELQVDPGYSRKAQEMLAPQELAPGVDPSSPGIAEYGLAGKSLAQLFRLDEVGTAQWREFLDVYRLGLLPDEEMAPLNPFPEIQLFHADGSSHWVQVRYFPIGSADGTQRRMLALLEDVSQQHELADQLQEVRLEASMLRTLLEDPQTLGRLLTEAQALRAEFREALTSDPLPDLLREDLFRKTHTLNGSAASLGLDALTLAARGLEAGLVGLHLTHGGEASEQALGREFPLALSAPRAQLENSATQLELAIQETAAVLATVLPPGGDRETLTLEAAELDEVIGWIGSEVDTARDPAELLRLCGARLRELRRPVATLAFGRAARAVAPAALRRSKQVKLVWSGEKVRVDASIGETLGGALIHLVRNAVAHGIEFPEERTARSKPAAGRLELCVARSPGQLRVEVADDGGGIDFARVARRADEMGLPHPAAEQLDDAGVLALLTAPGFTTQVEADEIAGRGVGLDAVNQVVHDLGGTLALENHPGQGCRFRIEVPHPD